MTELDPDCGDHALHGPVLAWYDAECPGSALARCPGLPGVAGAGQRGDAAADPGLPGAAGLAGVADRWPTPADLAAAAGRRGDPRLGPARVSPPGAAPARAAPGDRRAARRRGAAAVTTNCWRCPGSAATRRRRWRRSPSASGTPSSTPTSAGWWPGRSPATAQAAPSLTRGRDPAGRGSAAGPAERAARWGVAVMELGALICTARAPRCESCPVSAQCAWRRAGSPAHTGPVRRGQAWSGTDRQIRGAILAVLRASSRSVDDTALVAAVPDSALRDPFQRSRCLDGLVSDGLVEPMADGRFRLPG